MLPLLAAGIVALQFTSDAQTIKIASACPLSGAQAALGEMVKLGAQLAVEEAQSAFAAHGIKLELTPQDDQASPDVGVAVAKRMVNDAEILGVVGHFNSGVAIPASEVYKDYDLCMVSPANTNPKVTERRYPNINRVCGRDDVQGPVGAEFAVTELKAKRVLVINDKTAYGQGVAEAFKQKAAGLGATVVGFVGTEEKANFQSLILQMKVHKPDFVYFGGIYDQGGLLLKQMREKSIPAVFMGPDGMDSSEFVRIAQNAALGAYYTTVAGPVDQYPAAAEFAKSFEAKFTKKPESFALYAYDSANVLIAALKELTLQNPGQTPARVDVCKAVRKISFPGITGLIEFNDKGDRKKADYYIVQLKESAYPGTTVKVISAGPPGN
ncbi:MAG: branched chain amino acid ABC transporter substrate-binding protein [Lentisphaerae bacterium RIFOXYB12_FULL_65_16]|nr:MAG: branched chain amino acid ABC transporter substrate-binding protein [Lentisphaerae bacterium RIFOXYA12_64_32]OGV86874.1 MAG: branched chain amino acid ABC transporter substrate-binding protein [Lentisphaerae bacterium RIFOXYB12_FULL_65_16]